MTEDMEMLSAMAGILSAPQRIALDLCATLASQMKELDRQRAAVRFLREQYKVTWGNMPK